MGSIIHEAHNKDDGQNWSKNYDGIRGLRLTALALIFLSFDNNIISKEKSPKYSPSDYPDHPKKTQEYFGSLIPKKLMAYLKIKHATKRLTTMQGAIHPQVF